MRTEAAIQEERRQSAVVRAGERGPRSEPAEASRREEGGRRDQSGAGAAEASGGAGEGPRRDPVGSAGDTAGEGIQGSVRGEPDGRDFSQGVAYDGFGIGDQRVPASGSTEVLERPVRRQFTASYKLRILREADACAKPGEIGALLRREGLYSSLLTGWRRQRARGEFEALGGKKRGRDRISQEKLVAENRSLRRENARLARRVKEAETIIEIQKKASELLGIPLSGSESDGND